MHIGAGIASGLTSILIQGIWDTVDDYGLDGESLMRGAAMAAIGGALLAK